MWIAFGYAGLVVVALLEYLKVACYFEARRRRAFLAMALWLGLVSLSVAFLFVELSIHGPGARYREELERKVHAKIEREREAHLERIGDLREKAAALAARLAREQGRERRALRLAELLEEGRSLRALQAARAAGEAEAVRAELRRAEGELEKEQQALRTLNALVFRSDKERAAFLGVEAGRLGAVFAGSEAERLRALGPEMARIAAEKLHDPESWPTLLILGTLELSALAFAFLERGKPERMPGRAHGSGLDARLPFERIVLPARRKSRELEERLLVLLSQRGSVTKDELLKELGVSEKRVRRALERLRAEGKVVNLNGNGRKGAYSAAKFN